MVASRKELAMTSVTQRSRDYAVSSRSSPRRSHAPCEAFLCCGCRRHQRLVAPDFWVETSYYFDGPWSGPGCSYAGWDDYAARYGIGCRPGTTITGGDGILYVCQ